MADIFRLVSGIVFIIVGFILLVISIFAWPVIFYALGLLIVGILLLVNAGNEDKIEKVKSKNLQRVLTTPATKRNKKGKNKK